MEDWTVRNNCIDMVLQVNAEEEQADIRVSSIAGSRQSAAKVRNTCTDDQFDRCACLKVIKCCRRWC